MRLPAVAALLVASTAAFALSAEPPEPYGPTPSERQLRWHELEVYGFVHFTVNTFTDKEWGYGDESPGVFDPSDFDPDQIVTVAKQGGLRGLILTAKHHDGFCLWPTAYTNHSVKNSNWRDGQGDVVREMADACRRHGLEFGVYLSPWDRNHPDYGRPEYLTYYRNQLRELLTGYGPLFEVWFDGANGGDGYYGGARERRSIDNRTYYDWPATHQIVRELQPAACLFSDAGPDIRWVGNEKGHAGPTCWNTVTGKGVWPGHADTAILNQGERDGQFWRPAEVDVSIRPGWFYHASEDSRVKSPDELMEIYFKSVGRGANLLLNLPPDRRGQIHEQDAESLADWGAQLKQTFAVNLAADATATATNTRGDDSAFAPANVVDDRRDTYWCTDDAVTTAELELRLPRPASFDLVRIRERLPLGQRIDAVEFDVWEDGQWRTVGEATSIGAQRLIRIPEVTADRVRVRVTQAAACPAISELGLFKLAE
ncbi:Alpha-L-fucosidase [Posidoniimonas polymericola]|uniref:alpha-L-fucosidase n=1 Tax=Posidoniimonas polymericola TaxID=2528002 RepID=A0A5C5XSV0_9BACT|nr:alpha-L-fucosidase [Posidoniimonas polymericola]TWT66317.1 Alpha-L-fucosidase [Posidoniimonas polymericola]